MRKLFQLREWLTLPEAAKHLSVLFGEEVVESDVLRLCIENHLTLSLRCLSTVYVSPINESMWDVVNHLVEVIGAIPALEVSNTVQLREDIALSMLFPPEGESESPITSSLMGIQNEIVDVVMHDFTRSIFERDYLKLTGLPLDVTHLPIGLIIKNQECDYFQVLQCDEQLLEPDGRLRPNTLPSTLIVPSTSVPNGCQPVIKTSALSEFQTNFACSKNSSSALGKTERNTPLTIIAALSDYSAIKHQERGAAQRIMEMTDAIGAHVDDETIRKVLGKIPDSLETRMK